MMTEKRCTICARLIDPKRLASYPHSATCGAGGCSKENRRRVHNNLALRLKRARAAKKELAQRAAQTHGRASVDTSLPRTWADALGALVRAARAVRSICG